MPVRTSVVVALILVWCGDRPVRAQSPELPSWADSVVTITPGPAYRWGCVSASLAGRHYRDLWTTPIRVPVLNLQRFAGGLTPVGAHAGHHAELDRMTIGPSWEQERAHRLVTMRA
jgi:hypothetical protein